MDKKRDNNKSLMTLALLPVLMAMSAAQAGDVQAQKASAPMSAASKAQLARLCEGCALVTALRSEVRQGKASGLGAVGGAVLGGLLGNQIGGGNGKKIATVGGAVAGGMAGNELEKSRNKHSVWLTTVQRKDGSSHVYEAGADPGLMVGDVVLPDANGHLKRQPVGK